MKLIRLSALLTLTIAGLILALTRLNAAAMTAEPSTGAQPGARIGASASAGSASVLVNSVADAYVDSSNPGSNYRAVTTLYVGTVSTGRNGRALFRFDLTTIPTNAIVDSATFQAYLVQSPASPTTLGVRVYRINAGWAEPGVTWSNQPPASPTGPTISVGTALQYYTWDVKSLVQGWIASPGSNFGLELRSASEGTPGWRGFASRETSGTSPRLDITYHLPPAPTSTPTPTQTATPTPTPTSTTDCNADPYEPNDQMANAFQIQPDIEYRGLICPPGDHDFFKLPLAVGTLLRVQLYDLPADYQLSLYGPAGQWLDHSSNKGIRSEEIRHTAATTGDYYVRVAPKGTAHDPSRPYTLRLTLGQPQIQAFPGMGLPGSLIRLRGQGFEPVLDQVPCEAWVFWDEETPQRFLGRTPIGTDGAFDLDFRIPSDALPGTHHLKTTIWCGSTSIPVLDTLLDADTGYPDDGCASQYLPGLDLRVMTMEVTQGIQCLDPARGDTDCEDNTVPLVAGRPTIVRVYVYVANAGLIGEHVYGVTARLYVGRPSFVPGQVDVPETPLWPANGPIDWDIRGLQDEVQPDSKRRHADRTLNFRLPPEWLSGRVILRAVVNPDWACGPWESEENRRNNWGEQIMIEFQERNDLRIAYVPIAYTALPRCGWEGDMLPGDDIDDAWQWMYKVYPMARPDYVLWPEPLVWFDCLNTPDASENIRGLIDELNELGGGYVLAWLLSGADPALRPPDQIVGWLPSGAFSSNGTSDPWYFRGGLGTSVVVNNDPGARGEYLAHEIGHNMGLNHPEDTPPEWPYADTTIQEYGFDVEEMEVKAAYLDDMMLEGGGNESNRWISPFSYRFLFDGNLRPPAPAVVARTVHFSPQNPDELALISGRMYVDNRGELNPIYRVPATGSLPGLPAGTNYCLEFLDSLGQQLHRRCFDLSFESVDGPTDHASFLLLEPYPLGTARIRLMQGTAVLAERVVSPNAPQVTVLTPNGSEQWDGIQTIYWQATDADGDPLTYSVFYSPDDGQSWRLVATGLTDRQVRWDTSQAGGGQKVRVRVMTTDGINTTSDDSDGSFHIPLKPPTASIAFPADGAIFRRPEAVLLLGGGFDPEGGELRGAALVWRSDRDGFLGTGNHIVTPELSRGRHLITLTATDRDGMTGTASMTLTIANADVDGDGLISVVDIQRVATCFGQTPTDPGCYLGLDLNRDGLIDVSDVMLTAQFWRR